MSLVLQHGDVVREDVDGSDCVRAAVAGLAFGDVTGTFVFEVTSKPPQADATIVAPLKNGMVLQVSGDELVVATVREHLGDVVSCVAKTKLGLRDEGTITLRWTEEAHGAVWAGPKIDRTGPPPSLERLQAAWCVADELRRVGAGTVVIVDFQRPTRGR